jgi:hypothetical protein
MRPRSILRRLVFVAINIAVLTLGSADFPSTHLVRDGISHFTFHRYEEV